VALWWSTRLGLRRSLDRSPPVLFIIHTTRHGGSNVRLRLCGLRGAIRHICVTPNRYLRPIENCICGLRCIERKVRSIFQTLRSPPRDNSKAEGDIILAQGEVLSPGTDEDAGQVPFSRRPRARPRGHREMFREL
jgi:hypothetical protein